MGANVHHQTMELLDSLHVDRCLVVLAVKCDAYLVLAYELFHKDIDLPRSFTEPAYNFGVVNNLRTGRELSLN